MRLEKLCKKSFIQAERWVNNPKYSATAQYSEVAKKYHPRFGGSDFRLPYFHVPISKVKIFLADPARQVLKEIISDNNVKFFIHPETVKEFTRLKNPAGFINVSPTSSTRTVLTIRCVKNFMIKLHLNKKISRFVRRLSESSVKHSILVSRECEKMIQKPDCPKEFAFLPETVGISDKEQKTGFIIREIKPRPLVWGRRFLVPFFALYSYDQKRPGDKPLLCQLIKANKELSPLNFFAKFIMEPFIKCWAYAFLNFGVLFESHGQNTLLELNDKFCPIRVVQRDFQSNAIDAAIRKTRGLKTDFEKHIIGADDYPHRLEQSLVWDHFIGDYLLSSFERFFEVEYKVKKKTFRSMVRKTFRKFITLEQEKFFFPAGHVIFGDQVGGNTSSLVYVGKRPVYR